MYVIIINDGVIFDIDSSWICICKAQETQQLKQTCSKYVWKDISTWHSVLSSCRALAIDKNNSHINDYCISIVTRNKFLIMCSPARGGPFDRNIDWKIKQGLPRLCCDKYSIS